MSTLPKRKIKKGTLKIISVIFSFILWLYVLNSANITVEKEVPLSIITPDRMEVSNNFPRSISYTLRGPRAFLRELVDREDEFTIDLNKFRRSSNNTYFITFSPTKLKLPFGVDVVKISPAKQKIVIEKTISKKIPLQVSTRGKLNEQLRLVNSKLNPEKIRVTGPRSVLRNLDYIETQSVDLADLSKDGEKILKVESQDERIHITADSTVQWSYKIRAKKANRKISDLKIRFLSSKGYRRSSHRSASITVLADASEDLSSLVKKVQIVADIPEDAKGKVTVPLSAKLPNEMTLLEIVPNTIEVVVK
jgi:YbbR domain-containing protein